MKFRIILMAFMIFNIQNAISACSPSEWKTLLKNGTAQSVANYIKNEKCDINQELDNLSKTPLVYAIEARNKDASSAIINAGGDVNYDGYDGKTPLYYAINIKDIDIAKLLIAHGANTNAYTRTSEITMLMFSILKSTPTITSFLVNHGASLDEQDKYGQKPVDYVKKLPLAQQQRMYNALQINKHN
ncbi:ankyrin repeat domain-containing protein [Chromobacterium paludis]|uniref:Uncharacterized protein n=1 Tax=Chromobacterium paludis TaxID=2605945 RepID=A0A5C1DDP6_9NEIS|nr:ankyrin repeat domain-containing protein [Chromobacterium paludis]QEL54865.1 hypothetical protein FYK34_04425 [Chromobacterium paludis]